MLDIRLWFYFLGYILVLHTLTNLASHVHLQAHTHTHTPSQNLYEKPPPPPIAHTKTCTKSPPPIAPTLQHREPQLVISQPLRAKTLNPKPASAAILPGQAVETEEYNYKRQAGMEEGSRFPAITHTCSSSNNKLKNRRTRKNQNNDGPCS